jgi:ABC-2 type transport system permease protein
MRNVLALAKRILQQFSHDPRTIVLFIGAPVVALWLFSAILGSPDYNPKIAAVDLPREIVAELQAQDAHVTEFSSDELDAAIGQLANEEIDALLTMDDETLIIEVEGANSSKTGPTIAVVQAAVREPANSERDRLLAENEANFEDIQKQLKPLGIEIEQPDSTTLISEVEVTYLHGSEDWGIFDFTGPVFIIIFTFVFVFITSGMSLVTERTGGTMERLLTTPIKSWQLVAGYALGFGAVSLVQAAIVLWACLALIGFPNEGSLALVFFLTFSTAITSLTLGLLVSGLAKSGFQVIQLMMLFVVPQILLSGIFDLSQAPEWMRVLSACFPMAHAAEALRDVMLRGASLTTAGTDIAILWVFIVVFFIGATATFNLRRSR